MDLARIEGHEAVAAPCPTCGFALELGSIRFAGMPILTDATCSRCDRRYWLDWPAGHALLHPVVIDVDSLAAHIDGKPWYARRLLRCVTTRQTPVRPPIRMPDGGRTADDAVLVNCVDFLYGHALLKLLSATRHLRERPSRDVIVILPTWLAWLAPDQARVIEVDVPLRQGDEWIEGLDEAVEKAVAGYRAVAISPAVSQPRASRDDLAALGPGLVPARFWADLQGTPQVSFIIRDDRLWLGGRNHAFATARRLLRGRRTKPAAAWISAHRQRTQFAEVARLLHRTRPDVRLTAVGIGAPGGLPRHVADLRCTNPTLDDEYAWLDAYSRSRVVVGVHGSNMLLPSALAGAVVELMPRHKLQDIGEDLIVPADDAEDPKLSLFRYRMLPETTPPDIVADTVISILDHAAFHHRNMVENAAAYEAPGWPRPVRWRPLREAAG